MSPTEQSGAGTGDTIAYDPDVANNFALKSAAERLEAIQRQFTDDVTAAGNPVPEVRSDLDEQVEQAVGPTTAETTGILKALTQLVQGNVTDQAAMDDMFQQIEETTNASMDGDIDVNSRPKH